MANLSGTLGCPACKLGTFQPGLLVIDATCTCIGKYKVVAHAQCNIIDNSSSVCFKTSSVTLGNNPANCNCPGTQPKRAASFVSSPLNCPCSKPHCKTSPVKRVIKP